MTRGRLAIHAHFYQPERRDPFGGRMRPDPSAAPYASWSDRITAECYRPNAERGNLDRISFNIGPTLTSVLAADAPDVLARIAVAAHPENALAQAFHHAILPLASLRDRRTEIRWGIRDYRFRFGHAPTGFWLPETAVDEAALRTLAEEGIRWTVLAPWQAVTAALEIPAPSPHRPRRRAVARRGLLRRGPVRGRLLPARGDGRRRPIRPRLGPAAHLEPAPPGQLVELAGGLTPRGHRDRRRAVRPPPAVPRPVPRAARGPGCRPWLRRGVSSGRPWPPRTGIRCRTPTSPIARPGAATTVSCAGRASVRARRTGAGSSHCAPRWSGLPARSTR